MAGLGSAAVHPSIWAHPHRSASRKVGLGSDTWAGESSRSVSQSAGKEGQPLAATADFRRSSAPPLADVLEDGSQRPMLRHIVTRSRRLLP